MFLDRNISNDMIFIIILLIFKFFEFSTNILKYFFNIEYFSCFAYPGIPDSAIRHF